MQRPPKAEVLPFEPLPRAELSGKGGILPCQTIRELIKRKVVTAKSGDVESDQVQPSSLDLRLGRVAYCVRASFLPGKSRTVDEELDTLKLYEVPLDDGAVLERGCVYVVELQEILQLPESFTAVANPKSSTGRLDVFTRLITDNSEVFDYVEPRYQGKLYAEISPRTFRIRVRTGSRLNQLRFLRRGSSQDRYYRPILEDKELKKLHKEICLADGDVTIRNGLNVRVDLSGGRRGVVIGYRALPYTGVIDLDEKAKYKKQDFWEPIRSKVGARLILYPNEFYILASKERMQVPPNYAAEMIPIDPMMGEFRAHYAGFFDPGFGHMDSEPHGSRAVLEVRSHDVPFTLEDGQIIARLAYEHLAEKPDRMYGQSMNSHYQGQGLKLSKHFK
ncbi:MAG: 2'-deoxycytidine 5'-triphosphate deaminase [Hyphomicrobium sp.]|nr:2'-deoxycytidine 5'-triphosphate deaminase [Hyphomicrobium sp.]